ncbi:MAG: rRNA pseudouridine synthase [Chloroflexi bacterium]|nr:rRNA pseudouridine synthase [Chloroflexota bacterium]
MRQAASEPANRPTTTPTPGSIRLHKVLADAGVASRRHAEALIADGRVRVNGVVVREMGVQVKPDRDRIQVDGQPVEIRQDHVYLALNKPRGVVSTASDPEGRKTVIDLVPRDRRVYPVGRLDYDSEGLMLLTDDGAMANRLLHPRYEQEREYRALVTGTPPDTVLKKLCEGIDLEDGHTAPARFEIDSRVSGDAWLRVIMREGRNRQVRRMLEAVGYPVKRLVRARLATLRLGDLASGQWRRLTPREVADLRQATSSRERRDASHSGGRRRGQHRDTKNDRH